MYCPRIPYYIVQATRTVWDVGFEFILVYFGTDRREAEAALERGHAREREDPDIKPVQVETYLWTTEQAHRIGRMMFLLAPNTPLSDAVIPLSTLRQRRNLRQAAERLQQSRGY